MWEGRREREGENVIGKAGKGKGEKERRGRSRLGGREGEKRE